MKKLLSSIAATALIATSGLAFDPAKDLDLSKVYVNAGLALETVTNYDSGFALVVNAGLPIKEDGKSVVGAEVEITQTIVSPSLNTIDASITTVAAYSTYSYNINKQLFVKVRGGFLYESVTNEIGSYSVDTSDSGIAFGLHTGYNINEKMGAYVGYDFIETNVNHITLGMNYRF